MFSGDPVTGTGYLDADGGDRYYYMSTGPFSMAAGDSQQVIGAKIIASGADYLKSISVLRSFVKSADSLYQYKFNLDTEPGTGATPPEDFKVSKAFPNPLINHTVLKFQLPVAARVKLQVYNIRGQRIFTLVDKLFEQGEYTTQWNGCNAGGQQLGSGVYFIHFDAAGFKTTRKVTIVR